MKEIRELSEEELMRAILKDKEMGLPDNEIGKKYGVSYKYIEKIITRLKGVNVSSVNKRKKIKFLEPPNFNLEETSVWSFKQRGNWATHSGEYRGNFSPYIPRNIILRYSRPGEMVLDMFCGGGTTAIECKLLGRRCIASDINEKAIELARENLAFNFKPLQFPDSPFREIFEPELYVKDARDLSWIEDESIDLICTHPPYANIIQYTDNAEEDLSFLDIEEFLREMQKVAKESFRVLKPGRQCALLIGDTRRRKHVIPLGFLLIDVYLKAGFKLRELIIKRQHNCKTTGFWYDKSIRNNFLLLAHEYLPVFEKPIKEKRIGQVSNKKSSLNFFRAKITEKDIKQPLETTTVWIFPENKRNTLLSYNLIKRYASEDSYIKILIDKKLTFKKANLERLKRAPYQLIWIDSKACEEEIGFDENEYLDLMLKIVKEAMDILRDKGYLAIGTKDVRENGIIVPFAKLITEKLSEIKTLWLKEIVIITSNDEKQLDKAGYDRFNMSNINPFLKIVHSYLLIYEKVKNL